MRIDVLLAHLGLAESRTKARAMVEEGRIYIGVKQVTKASLDVTEDTVPSVVTLGESFVGRGALKLSGALTSFGISPAGMRCLDVGASTGGFTDCLLRRGAAAVTAVDCGKGQLAARLLADPRVRSVEGQNARYMTKNEVGDGYGLCVCDLSFISQTYVLPAIPPLLASDGLIISLIKPQFELDAASVSKGVVRGGERRLRALWRVYDFLPQAGLVPLSFIRSPITGGDGNTEYFALLCKAEPDNTANEVNAANAANEAITANRFPREALRALAFEK